MRKRAIDPNRPVGRMTRIKDFLPPPEELAIPEDTVKITILVNKSSVDFFKHEAGRYHTKYQRMIRELLDRYALRYQVA